MLPFPSGADLIRRLPQLIFGLVLFGVGVALMVIADLGLSPWQVLHQGISIRSGLAIGTIVILTGLFVLLLWIPLGEKIGIGTVLNVLLIGNVINVTLLVLPESFDLLGVRWALMLGGVLLIGLGSGLYIGAGLGPGPRDGVMTGLARRGIHIGWARGGIEVTVLVIGWLLGGTVGFGTLVFAFGMGPLITVFLPRLSIEPVPDYSKAAR